LPDQVIHNEEDLLLLISQGDEAAFRIIYDQYRQKIYGYAFHITDSQLLADEVIQEVFLKVWLNRSTLIDVKNFNAWLHAIARNYVYDSLKAAARELQAKKAFGAEVSTETNEVENALTSKINEKLLNDALKELSPQQLQVYKLSREQGLKRRQIAQQLNISENTVKTHLANAMQIITTYLTRKDISLLLWTIVLKKFL
jgi:RNA polymerase sigma-70 factor (ECF subfamily)